MEVLSSDESATEGASELSLSDWSVMYVFTHGRVDFISNISKIFEKIKMQVE